MAPLETLLDASYGFYSSRSITDITFNIQITRHAKQQRFNTSMRVDCHYMRVDRHYMPGDWSMLLTRLHLVTLLKHFI